MASIKDVAALAGVSPATVSRVMNGTAKVDPEKKARVLRVIEETGFVPNEIARSLPITWPVLPWLPSSSLTSWAKALWLPSCRALPALPLLSTVPQASTALPTAS